MGNPTISFRLSPYQLARGLQIIRNLEPEYQLTSISKIVKVLYIDYLAKMSMGRKDTVPQYLVDEIESLIYQTKKPAGSLGKVIEETTKGEKSIKNSVEDFSPPKEWR